MSGWPLFGCMQRSRNSTGVSTDHTTATKPLTTFSLLNLEKQFKESSFEMQNTKRHIPAAMLKKVKDTFLAERIDDHNELTKSRESLNLF